MSLMAWNLGLAFCPEDALTLIMQKSTDDHQWHELCAAHDLNPQDIDFVIASSAFRAAFPVVSMCNSAYLSHSSDS